jgi:lysophospholipase L1-like esterase
MSAKYGSMRSFRLLGCLMAVVLLASALFASTASAKKAAPTPTAYVALGDSLSFGYKAATFNANQAANKAHCEAAITAAGKGELEVAHAENALCEPVASFEGGFVGYFGHKLASTEKKSNMALTTVNLGCPGETSDGLIGHAFGGAGSEYNPCSYHNFIPGGNGYPLKTEIGGSSELEAAAGLISTKSAGTVTAVSLQIGSNDQLAVVAKCENPTYDGEHGFSSLAQCLAHEAGPEGYAFEGGLFHHVLSNIGVAIGVLRGAGYEGKILVIGFYNPDATILAGSNTLEKVLNENLEGLIATEGYGPNVKLAQPFSVINPEAAAFTEGETAKETEKKQKMEVKAICKYTEMCVTTGGKVPSTSGDIHPTEKGYKAIGKLMVAAF